MESDAYGKTLSDLRSELKYSYSQRCKSRFQLEIAKFNSQRAYLTINSNSVVTTLNDQTTDLRDILSTAGRGIKPGTVTRVKLQRKNNLYEMWLRDIFSSSAPKVPILNGDHILWKIVFKNRNSRSRCWETAI